MPSEPQSENNLIVPYNSDFLVEWKNKVNLMAQSSLLNRNFNSSEPLFFFE